MREALHPLVNVGPVIGPDVFRELGHVDDVRALDRAQRDCAASALRDCLVLFRLGGVSIGFFRVLNGDFARLYGREAIVLPRFPSQFFGGFAGVLCLDRKSTRLNSSHT